jgi:hypothetical protein
MGFTSVLAYKLGTRWELQATSSGGDQALLLTLTFGSASMRQAHQLAG